MSLRDSLELMESMRDLYSSQEDADKIRELRRMRGEIHAAFRQREAYMAELIRGAPHTSCTASDSGTSARLHPFSTPAAAAQR